MAICSQTVLSKTSVLCVGSNMSPKSVLLVCPNVQTIMVNTLQIVIYFKINERKLAMKKVLLEKCTPQARLDIKNKTKLIDIKPKTKPVKVNVPTKSNTDDTKGVNNLVLFWFLFWARYPNWLTEKLKLNSWNCLIFVLTFDQIFNKYIKLQ